LEQGGEVEVAPGVGVLDCGGEGVEEGGQAGPELLLELVLDSLEHYSFYVDCLLLQGRFA
jgi:hypothetical protein